ncbi:ABC transporter ATP-binding protein [Zavarzinia compransoris]|uniref:ABC transporter ATP-binding protein n=1 Tax=Zavarzinia compransoris TaxID=1264899 RepID=A0A317DWM1_9PROT|nr:oligopeptide/dipeptide ABC transporter ATP-binding protein [Zavarzinia compransoris]PWR18266.1 ABC transporter ATP-binding protein [Zavarzinia compransoris]TDP43678.1 peptide/nickel transport system ATP-binding protein [Zavarzinia compransoris]
MPEILLEARHLHLGFRLGGRPFKALDDVSIAVHRGEAVGLVGESGSGKTSAALALLRVHRPAAGSLHFAGQDITHAPERGLRALRRRVQMVFQDPYGSLDPRWTVERIIAEPLVAHGWGRRDAIAARVRDLLAKVGLPADAAKRLPSQFSGGQRQRIAIARALALSPDLVVADEPVSALDVSIQAQIVNLLQDIRAETGVAYLLITHDLALLHRMTDRTVVMYLGRVVESGPTAAVVAAPQHPYTAALIAASPAAKAAGRERIVLAGDPPSPLSPPAGCAFHPRCPVARPRCRLHSPPLAPQDGGRAVACFYPGELAAAPALAECPRIARNGR